MNNAEFSGEAKLKLRERKISTILAISAFIGGIVGGAFTWSYTHEGPKDFQLGLIVLASVIILILTIYYFSLRDEYEKSRAYKFHAYGVILAAVIMFPWYFAGEQNVLPKPHVLSTFLIIFIPTYLMTIKSWFQKES